MTPKYKAYLLSSEWAQLRFDLYNHRGYKCEKCGSKKKLQVHHKHYKNIYNEEPEDLIILCNNCHTKEHKILRKPHNRKAKNKADKKVSPYTFYIMPRKEEFNLKTRNPIKYKAYKKWLRKRLR